MFCFGSSPALPGQYLAAHKPGELPKLSRKTSMNDGMGNSIDLIDFNSGVPPVFPLARLPALAELGRQRNKQIQSQRNLVSIHHGHPVYDTEHCVKGKDPYRTTILTKMAQFKNYAMQSKGNKCESPGNRASPISLWFIHVIVVIYLYQENGKKSV